MKAKSAMTVIEELAERLIASIQSAIEKELRKSVRPTLVKLLVGEEKTHEARPPSPGIKPKLRKKNPPAKKTPPKKEKVSQEARAARKARILIIWEKMFGSASGIFHYSLAFAHSVFKTLGFESASLIPTRRDPGCVPSDPPFVQIPQVKILNHSCERVKISSSPNE